MHSIRFYKDTTDGAYCAVCTCGWTMRNRELQDVQDCAAVHDLNEEAENARTLDYVLITLTEAPKVKGPVWPDDIDLHGMLFKLAEAKIAGVTFTNADPLQLKKRILEKHHET